MQILPALSQDDIEIVSPEDTSHFIEYKLLQGNHDINALVLSATPYCRQAAKQGRPLIAALDDMAQIVGYRVETVSYDEQAVKNALKKRKDVLSGIRESPSPAAVISMRL